MGELLVGGGNSNIFLFSPRTLGKMNPIWQAYFSSGLVQPPTSEQLVIYHGFIMDLNEVKVAGNCSGHGDEYPWQVDGEKIPRRAHQGYRLINTPVN